MWVDPATGEIRNGVAKTNYSHDAIIDQIITNPGVDQKEIARAMGYSEGWVSQIMASDSFQAAFDRRKEELVDPVLRHSLEENFKALVLQSANVLRRKLEANPSDLLALKVMENASKALGYGARISGEVKHTHTHSLISVLAGLPPPAPREKAVFPTHGALPEPKSE